VPAQDVVASATVRYLGTSAQKARLVVDLIRGQDVGEATARLRHTPKAVARDVTRLLDSAVANARQKQQDVDVDRLYVRTAFVDGGPSLKRIRPAPMGRAFRVLKRMCHVTLGLGLHPLPAAPPPARTRSAEGTGEESSTAPKKRAGAAGGRAAPARRRAGKAPARRAGRKARKS
jgi:large subunit ribosomal protein L22